MNFRGFTGFIGVSMLSAGVVLSAVSPEAALTAVPVSAAPSVSGSGSALVTLNAQGKSVEDVAKDLSAQIKLPILVEPGITQTISARLPERPLTEALPLIFGEKGPLWARAEIVQPEATPLPQDALFDLVRALHNLSTDDLTVQLSGNQGTVRLFGKTESEAPPSKLNEGDKRTTLYVIARRPGGATDPTTEARITGDSSSENINRAVSLSRQRDELLQQMSPGERQQAMQQDLLNTMQLSPQDRMQMMMDRRAAMRSLPPETRQLFRQTMRQTWQMMGGGPGRRNRGAATPPTP